MKIIISFLFFTFQTIFASEPILQNIINGTDTEPGEIPYMAAIRRNDEDIYCGAALISDQHVLTAAHCAYKYEPHNLTVLVGTNDLLEGEDYFNVTKITISEDFNKVNLIGVSILTLSAKVNLPTLASPIALAKTDAPDGSSTLLTGYGYQMKDPENGQMTQILQKLPVNIVNQAQCAKEISKYEKLQPSELCGFTGPFYGACYGDSGSPLVYKNTLIGVALSVYPDCAEGLPDVYARITHYVDFIEQTISQ